MDKKRQLQPALQTFSRAILPAVAVVTACMATAQVRLDLSNRELHVDPTLGIGLIHLSNPAGRIDSTAPEIELQLARAKLRVSPQSRDLSLRRPLDGILDGEPLSVYFTELPVLSIRADDEIVDEPKRPAQWTYDDDSGRRAGWCGIELRGGVSKEYPKQTFDIELWSDRSGTQNRDESFAGLRDDDDWILDALYNEPLRLRSAVAHRLWLDIHSPHYSSVEPDARAGADTRFVEVFVNGSYRGLYAFSEQVDRKLLQLERPNADGRPQGELWKAYGWDDAAVYKGAPAYDAQQVQWSGHEAKYPSKDAPVDWSSLWEATDLVVNATDERLATEVADLYELTNLADYYLFINLLRALDNTGKNIYTARRSAGDPYFFVPWDLDGVFGTNWQGNYDPVREGMISNGLYDRLIESDLLDFSDHLAARWAELRNGPLGIFALRDRFSEPFYRLRTNQVYARERLTADNYPFDEAGLDWTLRWISQRLSFLDAHFGFSPTPTSATRTAEARIHVRPNPATGSFVVDLPPSSTDRRYTLTDVLGRRHRSGRLDASSAIEVSDLPAGLYILTVENVNGCRGSVRVRIQ